VTITNGYLSAGEAADYIGKSTAADSTILDDVVTAVSRLIDRHCGRHFYAAGTVAAPVARYFDAILAHDIDLGPFNDLTSVSTVKTDENDDGVYEVTWTADEYLLAPVGAASRAPQAEPFRSIVALDSSTFPTSASSGRTGLVEIAGVWGWPSVPIEVKQAARIVVAETAKLQDAPLGVTGGIEMGLFRVSQNLPPRARQLLAPLVHPAWVGVA